MLCAVLTLPIAQREMLVLAKSPTLYRTRITQSIVLLCLGIGFGLLYHYVGLQALGQIVPMLTFILLLMCLFAGVHLTADSIAKEKREGTLGLLLLTHLTPFQIVFGKLIAHGLIGFYSVIIAVPLLSLIMILGGTRLADIFLIAIAAFNTLFFSAAVGLWASSQHVERKKAGATGTWMVVAFWWGIPILAQLLNYFKFPGWTAQVLNLFAVNGMFNSTFAGPRVRMIDSPWVSMLCTHLLGWAFLGMAVYYVRTRWQDQPAKPRFSIRAWWKQISLGKPATRQLLRENLMDRNPFLWLASRDRLRSFNLWTFTVLMMAFMAWQVSSGWPGSGVLLTMAVTLCFAHKAMVSTAAAHQLAVEQEQGTLEMLLSTPLTVQRVIKGQLLATVRQFRGSVFLCMLVQLALITLVLSWEPFGDQNALIAAGIGVNAGIYLFDLYAMAWAGMWGVVIVKEAKNAAGAALLRIIVLPCLIFALVITVGVLANWYWQLNLEPSPAIIVAFWFLLGAVNNVFWLLYFRKRLPQRLREFALRRYSPEEKRSWFGRLGSLLGRGWGRSTARAGNQPPFLGVAGR